MLVSISIPLYLKDKSLIFLLINEQYSKHTSFILSSKKDSTIFFLSSSLLLLLLLSILFIKITLIGILVYTDRVIPERFLSLSLAKSSNFLFKSISFTPYLNVKVSMPNPILREFLLIISIIFSSRFPCKTKGFFESIIKIIFIIF